MKKLVLFGLMILSLETLYGQGFHMGLRAGINNWKEYKYKFVQGENQEYCFEKELFGRYEFRKWAFEAAVVEYKHSSHYVGIEEYPSFNVPYKCEYYSKADFLELGIRAYYNILSNKLAKRGLKCYIGMTFSLVNNYYSGKTEYYYTDYTQVTDYSGWNGTDIMIGISNNFCTRLSKKISLNTFIVYDIYPQFIDPNMFTNHAGSKISGRIGLSYSFN